MAFLSRELFVASILLHCCRYNTVQQSSKPRKALRETVDNYPLIAAPHLFDHHQTFCLTFWDNYFSSNIRAFSYKLGKTTRFYSKRSVPPIGGKSMCFSTLVFFPILNTILFVSFSMALLIVNRKMFLKLIYYSRTSKFFGAEIFFFKVRQSSDVEKVPDIAKTIIFHLFSKYCEVMKNLDFLIKAKQEARDNICLKKKKKKISNCDSKLGSNFVNDE